MLRRNGSTILSALSILLFVLLTDSKSTNKLPSNWKRCKRDDPKFNECLKEAMQDALRDLAANGQKSLGVLPLDPVVFNRLDVNQGSGPVAINLTFTNLYQHGFSEAMVDSMKADLENGKIQYRLKLEGLCTILSDYTINGKVLILPIQGTGKCNLTFVNMIGDVDMYVKSNTKNGKEYLDVTRLELKLDMSKMYMNFEGLFNGDKTLGDNMNVFLNENWKEIMQEIMPAISKGFGEAYRQIANRIFSKVPVDNIFL